VTGFHTRGTSRLDDDQQEFYVRRFNVRYRVVQEQPQVASRELRRKMKFRPKADR
jgi:hypothetical protein